MAKKYLNMKFYYPLNKIEVTYSYTIPKFININLLENYINATKNTINHLYSYFIGAKSINSLHTSNMSVFLDLNFKPDHILLINKVFFNQIKHYHYIKSLNPENKSFEDLQKEILTKSILL